MLFGSISYLNLLPFQLFLKKNLKSSAAKMSFNYKRAVPSKINAALKRKEVNAAFISSVESRKSLCTNLGIIAHKKVYSVLLLEGDNESDPASATSNQLAKVLDLQGKVLIGDAALKHYFSHTKVNIPQYILKKEAKKRGITPKQLTWYLEHIYYEMDDKAKKSLKLFLKTSKKI
jgi:chorismate dehydratase